MIDTVVFDMDGVIIDSEPFWREADILTYRSVGLILTEDMCRQTTGLGSDEAVEYWYRFQPWENRSFGEIKEEIFSRVMTLVEERGTINPGLERLMDFLEEWGIKIGLASSSPLKIINLVVDELGIRDRFRVLHSSDQEKYGKPHPDVYLGAVKKLGSDPARAMAFEDSFNGLLSAKSARMKAVAVLEPRYYEETRFDFADLKIKTLEEFTREHFEILNKF